MQAKSSRQIVVMTLVLTVHFVVYVVLFLHVPAMRLAPHLGFPFCAYLAWPLSQGSLIAIWASFSRARSYLRFCCVVAGLTCAWLLMTRVIPHALDDLISGTYAAMFLVQALGILLITTAGRLVGRQIAARRSGRTEDHSRELQFGLGTLLLWTTSFAATLGLGRFVFTQLGWTVDEVVAQQYFYFSMAMGVGNALWAGLVLASLLGKTGRTIRITLALILIGLLGYSQPFLLGFFLGDDGGIRPIESLLLAGFQTAYLYGTLVPLHLCGCLRLATSGGTPARRPTSAEHPKPSAR